MFKLKTTNNTTVRFIISKSYQIIQDQTQLFYSVNVVSE